jgi:two-component system CheB/CheR fusion protein
VSTTSRSRNRHEPEPEARRRLQELEAQNDELRHARGALECAVASYRELFELAPIGFATLGRDDRICELDLAGANLLGEARSLLIGADLHGLVDVRDARVLGQMLGDARTRVRSASCEVARCRDREPAVVLRITASQHPRADGGLLLAFEDITARKADAERLAAAECALRETDRRRDEFLAMLSHELRNPLSPIHTSLFVLTASEPGSEPAKAALAIIERQATHLTRLVDDLLDVTRITRGKIQLQRESVALDELLHRTIEDHRVAFEAGGVELRLEQERTAVWVDVDPARLVQATSNVLENALKFTPRGGTVSVRLALDGQHAVLSVRDTGVGIDPALLPSLFEPFAQAPQASDRTRGGLGLGLAIVKGFVELHGGEVSIASGGSNSGTGVVIRLPLAARTTTIERPAVAPARHGRRVLVIEDNAAAADSLATAISIMGHDVQVARDGIRGLELARELEPDIVLCDIGLPGMDGYEVARALRAEHETAFLVALSGYAQPEDVDRARSAGFDRHLAKPACIATLKRILAEAPAISDEDPRGHDS